METLIEILGAALLVILIVAIIAIILSFPVMWLWNWLMPTIFDLVEISFWQALGINLLCGFLFRSSSSNSKK